MREFPEIPEHLPGLILKLSQLVGGELVSTEPVACKPKPSDKCHDLLLDAVMQVALDATTLRVWAAIRRTRDVDSSSSPSLS